MGYVQTKAEIGVMCPQPKKCQGLIAGSHQKLGEWHGMDSPTEPPEEATLPIP